MPRGDSPGRSFARAMLLAAIAIAGTTTTRRFSLPPLAVRAFGRAPALVPRKAPAGTREPASRHRSRGLGSVAGNGGGGSDDAGPKAPASALGEVVEAVLASASEAAAAGGDNSSSSDNDNNDNNNSREEVSASVRGLLGSTLRRAYSTTATVSDARDNAERSGGGGSSTALGSDAPRNRYSNTTDTSKQRQQSYPHHARKGGSKTARRYEFPFATAYKNHPALNNVALAHALWASVIRPGVDSAIDATCGNGNDSVVLAEILFGANAGGNDDGNDGTSTGRSELLCLDVQELACQRTREALREALPASVRVLGAGEQTAMGGSGNLVRVLEASHETLPRPSDPSSVGLVVYNLGWLPGGDTGGKGTVTQAGTTLASMVDAVSLLRVGGMLSAITYPTTSPGEAEAVRLFVTCLALLSSKTRSWEEEVAAFGDDRNREQGEGVAIKDLVASCMERVVASGPGTWRVSQHDKLGMESPPVLFTATRIK